MFRQIFEEYVSANKLEADQEQQKCVTELNRLYTDLLAREANDGGFFKRFQRPKRINGVYMVGGVGRGKTMLMDLFFEHAPIPAEYKARIHFDAFMLDIHQDLQRLRQGAQGHNLLPRLAKERAKTAKLLCLDEFQVNDITDAMIIGPLFKALTDCGCVVVTTSNVIPDNLYRDGLQRQKFLPYIDIFKERMNVVVLDSPNDYRQQNKAILGMVPWFVPLGHMSDKHLQDYFKIKRDEALVETEVVLDVKGRELPAIRAAGEVIWFTFSELCEKPRGASDYLEITKRYKVILIHNVPKMGYDRRNEIRRFIALIDTLYDQECQIAVTAETDYDRLYFGKDHAFEFERTKSRLQEMLAASVVSDNAE